MVVDRIEQFDEAVLIRKDSTSAFIKYWLDYSIYTTFEFWLLVVLFIAPLVILMFKIDNKKIFIIGFFGYGIHIFTHYVNLTGINLGFWNYPILLIPTIPSITFDAVVVPVIYMFVYQWTLNSEKNYYIYAVITAAFFAFLLEPIIVEMGFFKLYDGANYFYRFLCFIFIGLIAKLFTNVFLKLQKVNKVSKSI